MATWTHLALHVINVEHSMRFYHDYCGLEPCMRRRDGSGVVWLTEGGQAERGGLLLVLIPGGQGQLHSAEDYSHLGFALASKAAVDEVAERGRSEGCLLWEPREEPWPVGYYCGLRDPDGYAVEFSHGQPGLGELSSPWTEA